MAKSGNVDIQITGIKEIDAAFAGLSKLSQKSSVMRSAVRAAAKPVLKSAKDNVPVDEGKLKKSLNIFTPRSKTNFIAAVQPNYKKCRVYYAHIIEFGSKEQAAQPYLRPALDANKKISVDEFKLHFANSLNNFLNRTTKRLKKQNAKG